jgi:hypothetical protein
VNDEHLKKLFEAARKEPAPAPSNTFADRVVASLAGAKPENDTLFDLIGLTAQRLLVPAIALVAICLAAEVYFSPGIYSAPADTAQLTEEWLFTLN